MNSSQILALLGLANGDLYATMTYPSGALWSANQQVSVRPPTVSPQDSSAICIVPNGDNGYYTDFPVEDITTDENGHVVLSGPKGFATFSVVSK